MFFDYLTIVFSSFTVYLFLIVGLRLFGKKELAQLSVPDLVFVLLISNAVQNAMVGSNSTLSGGLVAALTLFLTNRLFKWLIYKFPILQQTVQGQPIVLIYQGVAHDENMRKVQITLNELIETIREHGCSSINEVNLAMLETDGNISVLSDGFKTQSIQSGLKKKKKQRSVNQ